MIAFLSNPCFLPISLKISFNRIKKMNKLAAKLRAGTQQSHSNAEHTGFMTKFLQGKADQRLFTSLLSNLYYIYSQLEAEMELRKEHPLLARFDFPQLKRTGNLKADMAFYFGSNWREKISPCEAAQAYIARIHEVAENEPILLLGHSYTRYMGDLSGGQGIRKIARITFNLPEDQGTRFYEFDQIADVMEFKNKYREALNSLPVDNELEDLIVNEANISFNFNIAMMKELEQSLTLVAA
jgi:heme oxygenase (biliverdin-producing, ferredoxin)